MEIQNELMLNEFEVKRKYFDENDNLCFDIIPISGPKCCPYCGSVNFVKNGGRDRQVKDLPILGKYVYLEILGNRYICKDCIKSFTREYEEIDSNAKVTNRLKQKVKECSLRQTLEQVAVDYNLTSGTVSKFQQEYIEELEKSHPIVAPRVLGIDEAHLNNIMRCVYTDIESHGLIDIQPSRSKKKRN